MNIQAKLKIAVALAIALSTPAAAVDAGLLNLLVADTCIVMGVDVDRSSSSPFGRYLLSEMQAAGHDFDQFAAVTGFDPRRDLTEVVAGARNASADHFGVVVARGSFDAARIVEQARSHGASVTTHQGVDILTGPSEESGWFGFLNNTMVVGGGADAVRAAIDRWRAGSRGDPAVAAKAAELSSRYDAWALILGSPAMLAGRVPDATVSGAMKGDVIQAIEQMSGGLTFGAEVVISAEAMTRTDQDATVLADVIRFLFSMAQLHGNPETAARFAELARKMELTTVSNRVNFSLSIPEAQFEELFRMLPTKPHTRRAGAVDQAGEPD